MNLIFDIGNSRIKAVAIDGRTIVGEKCAEQYDAAWLEAFIERYPEARRAIVASTRNDGGELVALLRNYLAQVMLFEPSITPIPIANDYLTPATLGADRLAAAVGAQALYPDHNIMIVDFGTAITIDYVEGGAFKGGNISPGVTTRFRALHDYTSRLPFCTPSEEQLPYGRTTREAIEQGVMRGVEHEIRGYAEAFYAKKAKKCIIFTGGDAKYFVMRIKNAIFADCEPVIFGLSTILDYNAEKI